VTCIKDLSLEDAEALFAEWGEKPFRARQLFVWLYEKNVASFAEMTTFSKVLRARLDAEFEINALALEDRLVSAIDGTEKYLFRTSDGNFIESVLIKRDGDDGGRLTECISSQVGCAMGCAFCSTARMGFVRNLTTGEIVDQICQVRRISGLINHNVVFMGMGEPLLNYDAVMKAAAIINYSFGFHVSVRRITISTCGITPAIERYIDERRPYNLAISLNDTLPEARRRNMPVEGAYPIAGISRLLDEKAPASRNRVTLEYVMRKDNIGADDARRLKSLFRASWIKLNLIPLNPGASGAEAPTEVEIARFVTELEIMNVPVTVRKSFGSDIAGACGQLSGARYHQQIAG